MVKLDKDGDFVVTWMGLNQTGDAAYGIYARRYQGNWVSGSVRPYANEIHVNTSTTLNQTVPTVGMSADGDFVVSWSSQSGSDTSNYGVYAQRYTAAAVASFGVTVANRNVAQSIHLPQALAYAGQTAPVVIATLDSGVDYTSPDLYQNIWINQGEIPPDVRARLVDVDHDNTISFADLNAPVNRGIVADTNGNGYIDGGDLLAQWSDGIDQDHNGYVDDILGWNFVNNTNNPYDVNGHGTSTAGVVVAVDPHALIMPLEFIGASGTGYTQEAIAALQYSIMMGAQISTGSWQQVYSDPWLGALLQAQGAGQIFVAAAGNDDPSALLALRQFHLDNVIVVGASDGQGHMAPFSNADPNIVDIAAPGVGVTTTAVGGGTTIQSGTSVAAAFVAGAAGLVWGNKPSLYYGDVLGAIVSSAQPIPGLLRGTRYGGLDVLAALRLSDPRPGPTHDHGRAVGIVLTFAFPGSIDRLLSVIYPPPTPTYGQAGAANLPFAFIPGLAPGPVSLVPTGLFNGFTPPPQHSGSGPAATDVAFGELLDTPDFQRAPSDPPIATFGSMETLYARSLVEQLLQAVYAEAPKKRDFFTAMLADDPPAAEAFWTTQDFDPRPASDPPSEPKPGF
jgi:hypothetical protein